MKFPYQSPSLYMLVQRSLYLNLVFYYRKEGFRHFIDNNVKTSGCTTNFPKSKNIGFRYSIPTLKEVNKSQYFSKSPLGDLG
ncbi:MAG: hypothetical protein PF517_22430, partial [Salinivirgaceae bacterium]|nr:hypothetical protein [Salinivirgaceae bacterium]